MNYGIVSRLSIMMFLQFFVWGAWYVTAPLFLGSIKFGPNDFGWTYSVGPIAGLITPLFVGMVADRYFSAQRILGVLHLAGGLIMYFATTKMVGDQIATPATINALLFAYMLTYFPTLALSNTVAMKNIQNAEKEFPVVRVFGTIGWVVAGYSLTFLNWDNKIEMFYMSATASILLGLYSFLFLPATPPTATANVSIGQILGVDALQLLKDNSYRMFMISSILICIPLAFYYQIASRTAFMLDYDAGVTLASGQVSEIFFMLIMPMCFARLGVKWMLLIGMLAWVARYTLFAMGATSGPAFFVLLGILLHGICYDFFFVTGQIYTDMKAPAKIRGQAQGLLVSLTLGVGMLIGAQVAGKIESKYTPEVSQYAAETEAKGKELQALSAELAANPTNSELKERYKTTDKELKVLNQKTLAEKDWKMIWGIPAVFAAAVAVFFGLTFHDKISAKPTEGDLAQAASKEELV